MEAASEASRKLPGPHTSSADLAAYFQQHFSNEAIALFGPTFQHPVALQYNPEHPEHAETQGWVQDDLGYYDDGVKRTLTDEQIDMFRQSEIRELRREQQRPPRRNSQSKNAEAESSDEAGHGQALRQASEMPTSARGSKKKKKKGALRPRHEPKPDLRKRTWDVVEPGLDTLEYD